MSHAYPNPCNAVWLAACWRPEKEDESKAWRKSRGPVVHLELAMDVLASAGMLNNCRHRQDHHRDRSVISYTSLALDEICPQSSWPRPVSDRWAAYTARMSSPRKAPTTSPGRASLVRALGLLVAVTGLALSPVLFADFIRLDDHSHLFNNPHLQRMSFAGLVELWTKPYFNLYIPITYSAWWVLAMVGGLTRQSAWLFHALNLTIHLVNTALVFLLLRTLMRLRQEPASRDTEKVAWLAAFVFALHPLQVETVAWVSELKGGLAMMFGLLGLLGHCRSGKRVVTGACFVVAMLAKPSAIVFPGMVFLVDRILLGKSLRHAVLVPAIYGALLLPFGFLTKTLQPDLNLDFIPTFWQSLVVAADALGFYLQKLLLPHPLVVDYGRSPKFVLDRVPGWQIALSALVLLMGLAVAGKALYRPRPTTAAPSTESPWQSLVLCGWAFFLLSIAPVLGLVPFGFQQFSTVADHYLYVPMLGVSLVMAGLLLRLRGWVHAPRVAVALLTLFAGLSFVQARHWRSNEALFTRTLQVNPQSYLGAFSIGDEYLRGGHPEQSLPWFQKSLAINPDYLETQVSLGMAWVQLGQIESALDHYNAAIARNPNTVGVRAHSVASLHNNLGMLLLQVGREDDAVEQFRTAARIFPRSLNAHLNLGNVAMAKRRYRDAIVEYEKARELSPNNRGIEQRLGLARRSAQAAPLNGNVPIVGGNQLGTAEPYQ
jgi:protein O-mannosyl-transferase